MLIISILPQNFPSVGVLRPEFCIFRPKFPTRRKFCDSLKFRGNCRAPALPTKHFILPLACGNGAFSPPHYSVSQSFGSCADAPTISALHLVMQCSQTLIMPMMRYFLHKTQECGRQISSVSTKQQPPFACTLHGKRPSCTTSVTVLLLNQSP